MPTGTAGKTFEYAGDPVRVYKLAGPAWRRGENVLIRDGQSLIPYFDFVIMSRRSDDEPIVEIARFIITRRAMRRAYRAYSLRMIAACAKKLGIGRRHVVREVRAAVTALEGDPALR